MWYSALIYCLLYGGGSDTGVCVYVCVFFIFMAADVCESVQVAAYFCGVFGVRCGYCSGWMEFKLNVFKEQKI